MSAALPPIALTLIGIGSGHPGHLTQQATEAMRSADLLLLPHKGDEKAALLALRQSLCAAVLPPTGGPVLLGFDMPERASDGDYLAQVDAWHDAIAQRWQATLAQALVDGRLPHQALARKALLRVALLVWGDPSLYDSTLRIAARLRPAPQQLQVVPGITALQALTAAHAIAVNEVGQPFMVTTGRQLRAQGWPPGVDTVAVLLDGECSFTTLAPEGLHIWWGAYLGMPTQIIDSGLLAEAGARIVQARAQARQAQGWIMDIYLLRTQAASTPTSR